MTSPEQNGTQNHPIFEISVRYLLFGQPLQLLLLPAALLLLPHATPLLPPPLQLLQLLLGLGLAVPQLLQLLALLLLEALSDLLQALLRLQDGLRLLRLRGPAAQRRNTMSGSGVGILRSPPRAGGCDPADRKYFNAPHHAPGEAFGPDVLVRRRLLTGCVPVGVGLLVKGHFGCAGHFHLCSLPHLSTDVQQNPS